MRKTIITITVVALILSIVSTGVLVFIETAQGPIDSNTTLSAE
jgi:hypothetical protein